MNANSMSCDRTDARLQDWLEDALDRPTRLALEAHMGECLRCVKLVRDLEALRRDAAELPGLAPSRDLWPEIAARIATPVFPLESVPRLAPRRFGHWRLLATAAALVAVTAGVTYTVTVARHGPAGGDTTSLAAGPGPGEGGTPATLVAAAGGAASAEATYDSEISKLRTVLDVRRRDLEPATVAVVERSMATIDSAIADARAALAHDSASAFLMEQLNRALRQKLGVLRTVALLPARS